MTNRPEEYTFADAYIGSFVKNLMTKQDLLRAAQAKDLLTIEAMLREFGYGEAKEIHEGDIETFIRREQNKLFDLIYDTLPERKELSLLLLPFDYHNLKVCLKAEFLGLTPDDNYLVSTGDIDRHKIVAMVKERNYIHMSTHMKAAMESAIDLFGRGNDPQEIDLVMDKACYKEMSEKARESGVDFLAGLVELEIDLLNIKSFVRLKQMKMPWTFFQKIFLEGGRIAESLFIGAYEEPYGQFAEKLAPYGLKDAVLEGTNKLQESGEFWLLEKLTADALMEYNKKAKYLSFGIEPIAGYWTAKEVEIDNLRIILLGKKIGLSPEKIGERLRESYV
ncbi:MAG: V-type ATPase subunit [Peptostreptococcaceae bacterium]|nr:V-type ATPase subunit [Peptostreptococcaceae bacterium]MDY5739482.1 V-type ATPase subunit [Anaerovoracaceae bacterium]